MYWFIQQFIKLTVKNDIFISNSALMVTKEFRDLRLNS